MKTVKADKIKKEKSDPITETINRIVDGERKLFVEVLDDAMEMVKIEHPNVVFQYLQGCKKIFKSSIHGK